MGEEIEPGDRWRPLGSEVIGSDHEGARMPRTTANAILIILEPTARRALGRRSDQPLVRQDIPHAGRARQRANILTLDSYDGPPLQDI